MEPANNVTRCRHSESSLRPWVIIFLPVEICFLSRRVITSSFCLDSPNHEVFTVFPMATLYQSSLAKLSKARRLRVEAQLIEWTDTSTTAAENVAQLAKNIQSETALTQTTFTALLADFSDWLKTSTSPIEAWSKACRSFPFGGKACISKNRPQILGRAVKLNDYLDRCLNMGSRLSLKHALIKNQGAKHPSDPISRKMKASPIGNQLIWATFSETSLDQPFDELEPTSKNIRIALGLGCSDSESQFILLTYGSHNHKTLPLHQPTIADAGSYFYFCPNPDSSAQWGITQPLTPNPDNLCGRPELIHQEITGSTLVFPYLFTTI